MQHYYVLQKQNQEDRKLYEEATAQLYETTPETSPARRHGLLKAAINSKT